MTAVLAVLAMLGAAGTVSAASASPVPDLGTWSVASATWRYHDKQGQLRSVAIEVTQHRSLTGELTTRASVIRSLCHASGNAVTCYGSGPGVSRVRFDHDLGMSQAHVVVTLDTGQVASATWQSTGVMPSAFRTDGTSCIGGDEGGQSSQDYSVLHTASVKARLFGKRWAKRGLVFAELGMGAGTKPPC